MTWGFTSPSKDPEVSVESLTYNPNVELDYLVFQFPNYIVEEMN
jgi:hypothetical protein